MGEGVQKLGQQREHILNSGGTACCKKTPVFVFLSSFTQFEYGQRWIAWVRASLNIPNTSTRGICGFPVRIGRNALGVIVPGSHSWWLPVIRHRLSQCHRLWRWELPPSLCLPPYGAKASLEMAAQMMQWCIDAVVPFLNSCLKRYLTLQKSLRA